MKEQKIQLLIRDLFYQSSTIEEYASDIYKQLTGCDYPEKPDKYKGVIAYNGMIINQSGVDLSPEDRIALTVYSDIDCFNDALAKTITWTQKLFKLPNEDDVLEFVTSAESTREIHLFVDENPNDGFSYDDMYEGVLDTYTYFNDVISTFNQILDKDLQKRYDELKSNKETTKQSLDTIALTIEPFANLLNLIEEVYGLPSGLLRKSAGEYNTYAKPKMEGKYFHYEEKKEPTPTEVVEFDCEDPRWNKPINIKARETRNGVETDITFTTAMELIQYLLKQQIGIEGAMKAAEKAIKEYEKNPRPVEKEKPVEPEKPVVQVEPVRKKGFIKSVEITEFEGRSNPKPQPVKEEPKPVKSTVLDTGVKENTIKENEDMFNAFVKTTPAQEEPKKETETVSFPSADTFLATQAKASIKAECKSLADTLETLERDLKHLGNAANTLSSDELESMLDQLEKAEKVAKNIHSELNQALKNKHK